MYVQLNVDWWDAETEWIRFTTGEINERKWVTLTDNGTTGVNKNMLFWTRRAELLLNGTKQQILRRRCRHLHQSSQFKDIQNDGRQVDLSDGKLLVLTIFKSGTRGHPQGRWLQVHGNSNFHRTKRMRSLCQKKKKKTHLKEKKI